MAATQRPSDTGRETTREADRDIDLRDDERGDDRRRRRLDRTPETKTFIGTSEFWMTLVAVGAIAAIYHEAADTSLDLWGACVLGIAATVAYILSRGIAKSGTRRHDEYTSGGYR